MRFVSYGEALYALKALPPRIARHEYRLLRELPMRSCPVVEAVGVVTQQPGRRRRRARGGADHAPPRLLAALPQPLQRPRRRPTCATACSTRSPSCSCASTSRASSGATARSPTRSSGATPGTLSAYLVDAETGDLHPQLSDGQRAHDLQIAEENVAGELLDLEAAEGGLPSGLDPIETAAEVPRRYEALWSELTREDVFGAGRDATASTSACAG